MLVMCTKSFSGRLSNKSAKYVSKPGLGRLSLGAIQFWSRWPNSPNVAASMILWSLSVTPMQIFPYHNVPAMNVRHVASQMGNTSAFFHRGGLGIWNVFVSVLSGVDIVVVDMIIVVLSCLVSCCVC